MPSRKPSNAATRPPLPQVAKERTTIVEKEDESLETQAIQEKLEELANVATKITTRREILRTLCISFV
ncbi:hypothetical protein V6N12_068945 [Hibiscus sabdariffa]|uniref:Uncharacterized protein n=1 Tax=Hibiscus sabdariffa TaxID=183260 RepID=A0ABR2CA89_9ROSI